MNRSLKSKLILSYLVVASITVLVVSILIRVTSGQSLMNLVVDQQTVMLQEAVQNYYSSNGTMENFFDTYVQTNSFQPGQFVPGAPGKPPQDREFRGLHGLVDAEYRALIPTFGYQIGQVVPEDKIQNAVAVEVDGTTVAWILPDTKFQFNLSEEEQVFLQRTTLATGLAAVVGVIAAVGMGVLLAGGLLKPIRRLTKASQALAGGDLQQQVPVSSKDELGQLTATFNRMSVDLYQADQQRKRMTADITHDLSTPLQIISGYIEMLENGQVVLTPQRIDTIKTEIEHLRRLVGDLTTLAQVEAGGLDIQLAPVLPSALLQEVFWAYQPIAAKQKIDLDLDVPATTPAILVDEGRMLQVLKNLVENALRHTTKGGMVKLIADAGDQVRLVVRDNGIGIEPEDLPYVFDRFYRADKARGGNAGKMGLGLAICKALVTAQGGEIKAESGGKDQGTSMVITFKPAPSPE
jgi:signal transduction histidine kinase